jgi:hypothetical protein
MSNQARIICTVPTRHQIFTISSLSRGNYGHNPDGSLSWVEDFPTVAHAKMYLSQRAYQLAYDRYELDEMRDEIATYASLTYDEVTARIETI